MKQRLSPIDKKILRFMEEHNLGLTISQAGMLFYQGKWRYDYARIKLKKLWDKKVIRRYTSNYSDELIYYFEKKPSFHDNAVLNIYANFVAAGYKIEHFKSEQQWLDGDIRSDAFIVADNPQEKRIVLVEVDLNSLTDIGKYERLYETGTLQRRYGVFPMLVILSDVERTYKSDNFEIVQLDIGCSEFYKVLQ